MTRPGSNGVARGPRVLVGETYLDVTNGIVVRVLDALRSPASRCDRFVVEPANGERPGERWVRTVGELRPMQGNGKSPSPVVTGQAIPSLLEAVQRTLADTEALLEASGGLMGGEGRRLAARLRAVADKLSAGGGERGARASPKAVAIAPEAPVTRGGAR